MMGVLPGMEKDSSSFHWVCEECAGGPTEQTCIGCVEAKCELCNKVKPRNEIMHVYQDVFERVSNEYSKTRSQN